MSQYCKLLCHSGFYFVCGLLCFANSLFAQHADNIEGYLNYPLNKSFVIYDFANNVTEINGLHRYITRTLNDPYLSISKIEVTGYSSPEGTYEHNETLAQERAENLKDYLHPFFDDKEIQTKYVPEDWDGLVDALAQASYPDIETVRSIAQTELTSEEKEKKLKLLPRRIYKDLCRNYFPLLRRATLTIYCERPANVLQPVPTDSPQYMAEADNEQESYARAQQNIQQSRNTNLYHQNIQNAALTDRYRYAYSGQRRNKPMQSLLYDDSPTPIFAIGTNLLQWAGFRPDFAHTTSIPNIYIEYYFLKRWSVKGTFAYCDRSYDHGKRFQGISSYSIEPRFWLKDDEKYRGFFFGVYGQLGDYNQKDTEQNYTGKYYSGGISAGYLYPIYKGLAVEISLRSGYRQATVKKYKDNEECNSLCRKYHKNEFTVTGSCLSLIYRF